MLKLHGFFLTFFYFGNSKKAPGTIGSALAVILWFFLTSYFFSQEISLINQNIFWLILSVVMFAYGVYASPIYCKQFDDHDHQSIILDEVVGQIIALQISYIYVVNGYFENVSLVFYHLVGSFLLFRFFDICKPSLIGTLDKNLKNGFGVMLDDVLSGFVASLVVIIGWWIVI
jgi:phosphatidylglycerophosphatase A